MSKSKIEPAVAEKILPKQPHFVADLGPHGF